jgi:aspartate carbamoyltransferase catalytic subunit
MRSLKQSAIVMHPGPMNRGLEISAEVADSARSVITEQVTNGVSVRMAILYVLLAGSPLEVGPEIVRLSVGIENPKDLLADLAQALS